MPSNGGPSTGNDRVSASGRASIRSTGTARCSCSSSVGQHGVDLQRRAPLVEGHGQRRLGHPVGADHRRRRQPEPGARVQERVHRGDVDRLGAVQREPHARQVEVRVLDRRPGQHLGGQRVGEIRCGRDGSGVLADQLRPQQRRGQEVRRRDGDQLDALTHRQGEEADHAHVVEQRQPGHHHLARV